MTWHGTSTTGTTARKPAARPRDGPGHGRLHPNALARIAGRPSVQFARTCRPGPNDLALELQDAPASTNRDPEPPVRATGSVHVALTAAARPPRAQ